MLFRTTILTLLLSLFAGKATATQPILVPDVQGRVEIGTYVSIFSDPSKSLRIEDILGDSTLRFIPQTHDQIMVGQRREAIAWVQILWSSF